MYTIATVLLVAGTAAVARPGPEPQLLTNQRLVPSDNIGYIYYKPATGEMVRTDPGVVGIVGGGHTRGTSEPVWVNDQTDQCGLGEIAFQPIRDSATGEDTYWMDWGGTGIDTCVDTITVLYTTDLADPDEDGEEGFTLELVFLDGFDIGSIASGAFVFVTYTIANLPGSAAGPKTWMLTLDLSGGQEMELGNADGQSSCGTDNFNQWSTDYDGDGLYDFGFGFHFTHPAGVTAGSTGPVLVVPPSGEDPNPIGSHDVIAQFFGGDWCDSSGLYWFGGYDCAPGPGKWTPWAGYFLGLYGTGGPCPPDRNNDGLLDFFDIQDFLTDFAAGDPSADFTGDGLFDFFDVQVYLGAFVAGCP